MANNYTLFSAELKELTKEHLYWFKKHLVPRDQAPPDSAFEEVYEQDEHFPSFQFGIEEKGVWFYSEDSALVEDVVVAVQVFFNAFNLHDRSFDMTWACTCSKPRVDEFDGGAVFVTSKNTKWMNTGMFLGECAAQWKKILERRAKRTKTTRKK